MALDIHSTTSWWRIDNTSSDEGLTYFKRIAGADRYETMKKIVKATYNTSGDNYYVASVAVLASGENYPDALAANGLAGALNGGQGAPVLLTKKGSLSSEAKELLKNLQVQTVYIMGGTAAVSQEVEDAVRDMHIATIRVAGADRQATSVQAFNLIDGNWYKKHGTHSVIIASGNSFADALSISPFAYATGTPIILTKADGTLTDEAVKAIKANDEIWQIIVVGGTDVVSDSVFSAVGTYNGNYRDYYKNTYVAVRIAGADRYDTSAKIADWECNFALDTDSIYGWSDVAWADFSFDEIFVATGEKFPDALAGGQLAGGKWYAKGVDKGKTRPHSPILLTKDGNRSADAVIASHLAWNKDVKSVKATVYSDFRDYVYEIVGIMQDYAKSADPNSTTTVTDWILDEMYDGFFTDYALAVGDTPWDWNHNVGIYNAVDYVEANNFHGVILGGKNAVSKDKAKQLDETVDQTILKYWDASAYDTYHLWWDGLDHYIPLIQNHQLSIGVIPDYGYINSALNVIELEGGYDYYYKPYGVAKLTGQTFSDMNNTKIFDQTYQIKFAGFQYTKSGILYNGDIILEYTVDSTGNVTSASFVAA
jgi:putative cell wall-binding protein